MDQDKERRFETRAVLQGEEHPADTGDVITPIHLSSTFEIPGLDPDMSLMSLDPDENEFVYSRICNPTRHALEKRVAALEDGRYGVAFSSGTAAINTAVLSVLQPGDHLIAFDDLYGGTKKMFDNVLIERLDIDVSYVDAREPRNVADAIRPETKMLWMETPTNPLLKLCDIAVIADIADDHDVMLGVDNTFMSPYFQQPLKLGADLVAHSTTKYLNGHSDSIGGALIMDDEELYDDLRFLQQVGMGNMLSPFDSYQVLRGTKTLPARMKQHESNALKLAQWLEDHDQVEQVNYPGLTSHPQHELAKKQMTGFGGMISFEIDGGMDDAETFLTALKDIPLAVSLGGVESLVEHPASMTHSGLPREQREDIGITDALIRISVGLENPDDLIADLENGFERIK